MSGFIGGFLEKWPESVLARLLADKTTGGNILWAGSDRQDLGEGWGPDDQITLARAVSEEGAVMPRVDKEAELQASRVRARAEVFTPSWLCARMNDGIDGTCFHRAGAFGRSDNGKWVPNPDPVDFSGSDAGDWQGYVDQPRLEIACGEAPFLCSPRDAADGRDIPVAERAGFLDRKLRAVSENAADETEWDEWALRALQASYGYEYQGDSLLVARVNALETVDAHRRNYWGEGLGARQALRAATIIAWNLWQMDGLSNTPPSSAGTPEIEPLDLFDLAGISTEAKAMPCRVMDWRANKSKTYESTMKGSARMKKFYAVIGNPPYQGEAAEGNGRSAPLYNDFMDGAYEIGGKVELVTPARFLFNAGQTPKSWNRKMLHDPHLRVLDYEPDSSSVFSGVDIRGGGSGHLP